MEKRKAEKERSMGLVQTVRSNVTFSACWIWPQLQPPVYIGQQVDNMKIYKKHLAELSAQSVPPKQRKKPKVTTLLQSEIIKKNWVSSTQTLAVSSAKLIPTMRFRKVATIDTLRGPTVLSLDKVHSRSKSGTRSSTPAMRQALKEKLPVTRSPSNSAKAKEGKRKHDSLFTVS
jgi:hypothetical protein